MPRSHEVRVDEIKTGCSGDSEDMPILPGIYTNRN